MRASLFRWSKMNPWRGSIRPMWWIKWRKSFLFVFFKTQSLPRFTGKSNSIYSISVLLFTHWAPPYRCSIQVINFCNPQLNSTCAGIVAPNRRGSQLWVREACKARRINFYGHLMRVIDLVIVTLETRLMSRVKKPRGGGTATDDDRNCIASSDSRIEI